MTAEEQKQLDAYRKGVADACAVILETIQAKQIKDVSDLIPAIVFTEKQNGNFTVH